MRRFLLFSFVLLRITASIAQNDALADSLVTAGIRLHDEGNFQEALARFNEATRLNEKNGNALYEAGNTYFALADYKQALKYAEKAIKNNGDAVAEAFMLKGNALDMLGKPDKAIDVYREGIRLGHKSYLLHFNLGVTLLKQKKYADSEPEFIQTLKMNPAYTSAHYMLGFSNAEQARKVKTLLPFYYFLMIENEGKRAEVALGFIRRTLTEGVEKANDKVFTINMNAQSLEDEFSTADLTLSMIPITREMSRKALKDSLGVDLPEQSFSEQLFQYNESLFQILSEISDRPADAFWWDTYLHFFIELHQKGHTEAFTHYILLHSGDKTSLEWLIANKPKLEAFSSWIKE